MGTQYRCNNEGRRQAVYSQNTPAINGIDYLEVEANEVKGKSTLIVHFIFPLSGQLSVPSKGTDLTKDNVVIEGGVRVKDIEVESMEPVESASKIVNFTVNSLGDFSIYTLRIVKSKTDLSTPEGIDPQLSHVDFSFKVNCPSEFDCKQDRECPPEKLPEPEIDYLAKDYESFRRLMLDRLSVIMPDWTERNPADFQVALVEVLAYIGDNLSYFQDAVATEAYLGTARKRISVRRHARLLDYFMHEGCNARAWVCFEVDETKATDGKPYWFNWASVPGQDDDRLLNFLDDTMGISSFLFSWDEIPGKGNGRLIEYLKQIFGFDWVKTSKIERIDDGETIKVSTETRSLSLKLNDDKTKVSLKTDDGRTYELIAKVENNKLNVYRNTTISKPIDYLFSWDKIPGDDDKKLIGILDIRFGIEWIKTAKIEKFDDCENKKIGTIKLSTATKTLWLRLNDEKTKIYLKSYDGTTYKLIAKMENGELNIYDNKIIHIQDIGKSIDITLDRSEENAILKIDDTQSYSLQVKKEYGLLKVFGIPLPKGTCLLTQGSDNTTIVDPDNLDSFLTGEVTVFETMHHVTLYSAHNRIRFYTWNDTACCLPRGSTQATLLDADGLSLNVGDVLIFEEVCSPTTGTEEDADPSHRHAVRLTKVTKMNDPLDNTPVVEIEWNEDDALPFPLCISTQDISNIAVARGNAVLADHGHTITKALKPELVPDEGTYRPSLPDGPLTYWEQFNPDSDLKKTAVSAMLRDVRKSIPAINLLSKDPNGEEMEWTPKLDLLASDRFAADFVVENELDGIAYLRFGDDILGEKPQEGSAFTSTYRIGNGKAGNVGSEAISRIVIKGGGIKRVRNPLPACGGTDAEPMEQVRLYAPQAFRTQERAVTEADYEEMAQKHPGVQKAKATIRWTGSWHTAFVTIDRKGGSDVNDDDFKKEMLTFLERFRIAGYDIEIDSPIYVPLEIAMKVCVKPGYFRSNVKQSLLLAFSNHELINGRRGFFHPDNFTFSQPVYLSRIYEAAQEVAGVSWVEVTLFQRWGKQSAMEIENGVLIPGTLEIIRLDNDLNFPEYGKISFNMEGGL